MGSAADEGAAALRRSQNCSRSLATSSTFVGFLKELGGAVDRRSSDYAYYNQAQMTMLVMLTFARNTHEDMDVVNIQLGGKYV